MCLMYRYADTPHVMPSEYGEDTITSINAEGEENTTSDSLEAMIPTVHELLRAETVIPGIARAWLDAHAAREARADHYRALRLVSVLSLAMITIGIGQWALVQGAPTEALYLTGAGLAGLVASFLKS